MEDTKILLRNWKIVWTILAIIASLFVWYTSFKINAPFEDININYQFNNYDITSITISADWDLLSTLIVGFLFVTFWNILQIPIWVLRNYLCGDK